MHLQSHKWLLQAHSLLLQAIYEGLYEPWAPFCWPFNPSYSNQWPCDMCHSLIGWEKAQSMCFSLILSGPFLSLPPSCHLDRWSSNPSAYKLDPLPLQIITIIQRKAIMPNWEPKSYQFAIKIHHLFPNLIISSPLKPSWSYLEHTYTKSNHLDKAINKESLLLGESI